MNLSRTHEQQKQSQSLPPRTGNSTTPYTQSQIERVEPSKPIMPLMSDTDKEQIMGAIRTLDNQQKKEALMQSELEQAHLRLVKQLEALQTGCKETLSKQEQVSESTCRTLLQNVERANQSILKQNETLLKSRAEELQQNRTLLNSIQREVEKLTLSENLTREALKSNLGEWRDRQTQTVKETTAECVRSALEDVQKKSDEILDQYTKTAEKTNKHAKEYLETVSKNQKKINEWGDKFSSKVVSASIIAFISACILVFGIIFTAEIIKPVIELNQATQAIETVQKNCEIVNNQLNSYYTQATGETLQSARIAYYWEKRDYLGAVFAWIGAYWKNVLLIILIGSWVIYFIKKDRY